jgi:uncharacterized protein YndB with AHSA1/START domain
MSDPDYVYAIDIAAPPEAVWRGLTTPQMQKVFWFGASSQADWSKGAKVLMQDDDKPHFTGEVLESDPPRRLVFTFDADNGEGPSTVTYDLVADSDVTHLTVTHTGFVENSRLRTGVSQGWPKVLGGLKTLVEAQGVQAA